MRNLRISGQYWHVLLQGLLITLTIDSCPVNVPGNDPEIWDGYTFGIVPAQKGSKTMKRIIWALIALVLAASACGSSDSDASEASDSGSSDSGSAMAEGGIVGISMPTRSSSRWISDGDSMVSAFEALGYDTDLQYAEDDIPTQVSQIENMITKGANVLVIAAIDGVALSDVLNKAAEAGVNVVAYDRLIRSSEHVDYYATFDNFGVGVIQATSIVDELGLESNDGPFNIELFAGSPDDNNATFFFNGAMSVLQPHIDSGKLVVKSGQTEFEQVAILRWDGAVAQSRMDNLLSSAYTEENVHAILSPYDGLSRGIISSLKGVGYYDSVEGPVVTGQDAELESVRLMLAGEQTSTVFKDTRELAAQTAKMVDQLIKGETVEVNDTETYDNGVKVVPSFLLIPVAVTADEVDSILVDSGYWTSEEVNG